MENNTKRLKDFVTLQRGTTYKSRLLDQHGPYLLGLASIERNGGFRRDKLRMYGGESPQKILLHPGDLFVSLKDVTQSADLLGAVARVPHSVEVGRLTQDTVKLQFTDKKIPTEYIYWLLRTPQYRDYCRAHSTGTTNLGLPREDFLNYPVPTLNQSRKLLINLLEMIERKFVNNQRMNETLGAMAQALFKSWFVDFDPVIDNALKSGNEIPEEFMGRAEVRKNLGDKRKVLPGDVKSLFPSEFEFSDEMGWIPKGWKACPIGDEFNITMGQSPPGSTYNDDMNGIPFFQGRRDFGFRFPENRIYCSAPKRTANEFDTLVSVRAPVGDVNMAHEDCCIGRGVASVRHNTNCISFTYYSMIHLREHFQKFEAEGTVFGSINQKDFRALLHIKSNDHIVNSFEKYVSGFDKKIENNSRGISNLIKLRDSLLPNLLSGTICTNIINEFDY